MTTINFDQAVIPQTVGVREFTRNITRVKTRLAHNPLLVLNNNQPDFVALSPTRYKSMMAALEERRYAKFFEETVAQRKKNKKISWAEAKKKLNVL